MFRKKPARELEVPPIAISNAQAAEVLRVWAAPGQPQQVTLRTTWEHAGAWGLVLADVARHAANAYANEGKNPAEVLARSASCLTRDSPTPLTRPLNLHRDRQR